MQDPIWIEVGGIDNKDILNIDFSEVPNYIGPLTTYPTDILEVDVIAVYMWDGSAIVPRT